MAINPVPLVAFILATRLFTAIVVGSDPTIAGVPECEDFTDIITGCQSFFGYLSSLFIGVVPGAPALLSAAYATVTNLALLWVIVQTIRGI